jgi:hypothetical protein
MRSLFLADSHYFDSFLLSVLKKQVRTMSTLAHADIEFCQQLMRVSVCAVRRINWMAKMVI